MLWELFVGFSRLDPRNDSFLYLLLFLSDQYWLPYWKYYCFDDSAVSQYHIVAHQTRWLGPYKANILFWEFYAYYNSMWWEMSTRTLKSGAVQWLWDGSSICSFLGSLFFCWEFLFWLVLTPGILWWWWKFNNSLKSWPAMGSLQYYRERGNDTSLSLSHGDMQNLNRTFSLI